MIFNLRKYAYPRDHCKHCFHLNTSVKKPLLKMFRNKAHDHEFSSYRHVHVRSHTNSIPLCIYYYLCLIFGMVLGSPVSWCRDVFAGLMCPHDNIQLPPLCHWSMLLKKIHHSLVIYLNKDEFLKDWWTFAGLSVMKGVISLICLFSSPSELILCYCLVLSSDFSD